MTSTAPAFPLASTAVGPLRANARPGIHASSGWWDTGAAGESVRFIGITPCLKTAARSSAKWPSDIETAVQHARHGETAWSLSGQHTGLTDLPLTDRGERNAHKLGEQLPGTVFRPGYLPVLCGVQAPRTCELAGFGAQAHIDRDLLEWNYGEYEGLRTAEIHANRPDW